MEGGKISHGGEALGCGGISPTLSWNGKVHYMPKYLNRSIGM
jgi:hypothetical protein